MPIVARVSCSPRVHFGGPHVNTPRSQILWSADGTAQDPVGITMTERIAGVVMKVESSWMSSFFSPAEIGLYTPDFTSHTSRVSLTLSEADPLSGQRAQPEMSSSHRQSLET